MLKAKNRIIVLAAMLSLASIESVAGDATYIGKGLTDFNFGERSPNNVYGYIPYLFPALYFGDVSNGKFTPPSIQSFVGTKKEGWFTKNMSGADRGLFWSDRTLINLAYKMDDRNIDPFKREDAKHEWLQFLTNEEDALRSATGYMYKIKSARLKDYDIKRGLFTVDIGNPAKICSSPLDFSDFNDSDINLKPSNQLNKYVTKEQGNGLCVDVPNLTHNKFPFKELKTPQDVAKKIYDNNMFNQATIWGECEFKNWKKNTPSKVSYEKLGFNNLKVSNFASCPVTKLHILLPSADDKGVTIFASYVASYEEKVKRTVATPSVSTPAEVESFKDKSKRLIFQREKQVIDITN